MVVWCSSRIFFPFKKKQSEIYVWYGAIKEMVGDPCESFTYVIPPERIESQPAQVGLFKFLQCILLFVTCRLIIVLACVV